MWIIVRLFLFIKSWVPNRGIQCNKHSVRTMWSDLLDHILHKQRNYTEYQEHLVKGEYLQEATEVCSCLRSSCIACAFICMNFLSFQHGVQVCHGKQNVACRVLSNNNENPPLMDVVGNLMQNEQRSQREWEKGRGVNTSKLALGSIDIHLSDKLSERALEINVEFQTDLRSVVRSSEKMPYVWSPDLCVWLTGAQGGTTGVLPTAPPVTRSGVVCANLPLRHCQ